MDRRDFLKLASLAGLSVAAPVGFGTAKAQDVGAYTGPFYVTCHASGGWDPTSHCDPKGAMSEDEADPMNAYLAASIEQAGNIRYAPVANNQYFFQKYYDRLLVINGVDTETNGHDSGVRNTWSGRLAEGHPAFTALVAASNARDMPMAFITNGGYDNTGGLVGPTRVGDTGTLLRIAYPNRQNPDDEGSYYHSEASWNRILGAQRNRLDGMLAQARLPLIERSMSLLYAARASDNELARLSEFLPDELDNTTPMRRQVQVALAAYAAGISVSANLSMGGFDTHGNHDNNHFPRLEQFFDGVDFLIEEAERLGVADRVVVAMGSDFGRTPRYNDGNGKDHWSIGSMMFMGPGIQGNRVVGTTDPGHRPINVDPETLSPDENGIRIKPEHIHTALRHYAGIADGEFAAEFPMSGELLPLFG